MSPALLRPANHRLLRPLLIACAALVVGPMRAGAETPPSGNAAVAAEPASPAVETVVVSAPEPRYVAPTTRDQIGRIWAPVMINDKGPYRLVLDTGASRSALIRQVVDELALPERTKAAWLRGVTGSAVTSLAKVESLQFGELRVENTSVPVVADVFGGAQGILGGDGLDDMRIAIEFKRDRISIMRSHREAAPPGFSIVPFKYSKTHGMRVSVWIGHVRATALIDTGGQATVGNAALLDALSRQPVNPDEGDEAVIGVTADVQKATSVRIPSITVGTLIVRNASIVFSNLQIFDHWRLQSEPALIIGMDVLGVLDTLVIDYRRKELHIKSRS